jgi:ribosomal protein L7/L12
MNVTLEVSPEELVEITKLIAQLRQLRKDAEFAASSPSLTEEERQMAASSPIGAIKAVRDRLGCTLKAARDLVDNDDRVRKS